MISNIPVNTVAADHLGGQQQKLREFLTEAEVSEWLGLSQPTLSRHRHNGTGPAFVRLSTRRIGYRRSAVEAWLNEREQSRVASCEDIVQ